jgi:hypothetical protein
MFLAYQNDYLYHDADLVKINAHFSGLQRKPIFHRHGDQAMLQLCGSRKRIYCREYSIKIDVIFSTKQINRQLYYFIMADSIVQGTESVKC